MSAAATETRSLLEPIYDVTDGIASPASKIQYRFAFGRFLEYIQISQEGLLQKNSKELQALIIDYIRHLTAKRMKPGTIKLRIAVILHFFDMNDVLLNKHKIARFIPQDEDHEEDECYTHQEIQRLLSVSDERIRVAILLMASTGMRIGALPHLQLRDLTKIEQYNLYKIQVYARSMTSHHYTFCTPECAAAIDSYLAYRKRFGEPIGLDQKAPLIREQFNINDRFKAKHPKQAKLKTISETIDRMVKKSGIESKGRVRRNHGLRKFAITQMIKAKMDYASREYLVGHRHSRGLDRNYDRTTEEDRLSEFIKAVDLLIINSEHRLKQQIHFMKAEHSAEWQQLKEQMNELRSLLEHKV